VKSNNNEISPYGPGAASAMLPAAVWPWRSKVTTAPLTSPVCKSLDTVSNSASVMVPVYSH
jgi:hypothetical protein